jgi:CubicO group peptidase (beta-lactamase class C family)
MMQHRRWARRLSGGARCLGIALWASFSASASASAQFTPAEAAIAAFDAQVASAVADDAGGVVSVAVFRGDEVVWSKGWGWADIANVEPGTAETIGRTGSISKTFTAMALMGLVERGVVDLDGSVAEHLPEILDLRDPPVDPSTITFRQLASHTAGLQREPDLDGAASGPIQGWEAKILASIPTTGFLTRPGTEYAYSNIGYGMLGLAMQRAAGTDFMELVRSLIFAPLGLEDSFFVLEDPDHIARMSVGYGRNGDGSLSAARATREHFGRGYKVPNGGVYSTVLDLARFASGMMGTSAVEMLGAESRAEILRPQTPAEGYGIGLQISDRDGVRTAGHGGSVAGYNANLVFHPESGWGVAMLRTTSYNPATRPLLLELVAASGGR